MTNPSTRLFFRLATPLVVFFLASGLMPVPAETIEDILRFDDIGNAEQNEQVFQKGPNSDIPARYARIAPSDTSQKAKKISDQQQTKISFSPRIAK